MKEENRKGEREGRTGREEYLGGLGAENKDSVEEGGQTSNALPKREEEEEREKKRKEEKEKGERKS